MADESVVGEASSGSSVPERISDGQAAVLLATLAPLRHALNPFFRGVESLPLTGPILFVGNHTLFGVLDVGFLFGEIFVRRGLYVRGLGDHLHFEVPGWANLVRKLGVVEGTPENCAELFRRKESVLVFPGGGREVAKRKGELYKLKWENRMGFARLAIRHGVPIVPFASVGVEDAFDIVLDGDEILERTPLGQVFDRFGLRRNVMWPIVKGLGPTPLPRPERLYFDLRPVIDTARFGGDASDENATLLRDEVKGAIEQGIADMIAFRETDPNRGLRSRLSRFSRGFAR
jgi:1-acyl-sn-glycerol-3-phosphate acyltransferase